MKQRKPKLYGPMDPRRIRRMTRLWGERCEEHMVGCPTCTAWRIFYYSTDQDFFRVGHIPNLEQIIELTKDVT